MLQKINMEKLHWLLKKWWCSGLLALICVWIFIVNFPYNTWYTGWDNLHPEFDFLLNFKRGLFSVWQTNQGLGTYGGHGYAATLPHTFALWLLSFIFPDQYLRSIFTFLCLFLGAFGVFFLLKRYGSRAAFLGSLFYLLNLATAQQFYIQLEAFIVHFAALPWLFWSVICYLETPSRKTLVIFCIVSLLSSVQGFIPPLFFVYLILLGLLLFCYSFFRPSFVKIRKAFLIGVLTLIINLYWLLPVSYYATTGSRDYINSYNNLSSTEDFILKNKKYGNIENVSILKGFIFEAIDARNDGAIFTIFSPWEQHLDKRLAKFVGYFLFLIVVVGLVGSIVNRKRNYISFFIFISTVLVFSFLTTNTPPFSYISSFVGEFPVIKQAFRVAFTKFSIALALLYAICFAFGVGVILSRVKSLFFKHVIADRENLGRKSEDEAVRSTYRERTARSDMKLEDTTGVSQWSFITGVVVVFLIFFSWPTFAGKLLYERTKLNIPSSYFELFDFFDKQPKNERIANFPQGWNWGWSLYRWGYSGSGYLWYGIEQPIMDRAFDVWGKHNEAYFWELQYAIYSENFDQIDSILDKYNVSWITLDQNILPYNNARSHLYTDQVEEYLDLDTSNKYEKVKTFSSSTTGVRDIIVYKVLSDNKTVDYKSIIPGSKIKNVGPSNNYTYIDRAFLHNGLYYTTPATPFDKFYPFSSLFTARTPSEFPINVVENLDSFELSQDFGALPFNPLTTESFLQNNGVVIENNIVTATVPKDTSIGSYDSSNDPFFLNHIAQDCQENKKDTIRQDVVDGESLRFYSKNSENCYTIILSQLEHLYGYIIQVESRHIAGKPLQFAVINHQARKPDIIVNLNSSDTFKTETIVVPPMERDGVGYHLNFNNISIGNIESINELKSVRLYPIPFNQLSNFSLTNLDPRGTEQDMLVYYQSFDPGWKAYRFDTAPGKLQKTFPFIFGEPLKNHVVVNSWANGWYTVQGVPLNKYVVVFWPQYFEHIGLILLILSPIILILGHKRGRIRGSLPN